MRKFSSVCLVIFLLSVFGFTQASFAKAAPRPTQEPAETNYAELYQAARQSDLTSQGTLDSRFEALTKELQKGKELLAIWKDHVRSLTKERDEAYKEIETLKDQGASSSLPDGRIAAENEELKSELGSLRAALQAKAEKLTAVEKELQEAKDYFSSSMEELNEKTKKMFQENETLKSEIQSAKAERQKQEELQQALVQLKSENGSLKFQNDRLQKTQAQQSKTIQTLKSAIQSSLDSLDANS